MLKITFEYRDEMSRGERRTQSCIVSSLEECKKIYGLGSDPTIIDYKFLSIEEVK